MVTAWAAAKIKNIIIKLRVPARPRFVGMQKANSDHANQRRYTIYTSGDHYCSMLNQVFAIFTAKLNAKESVNKICRIPKSGSSNRWKIEICWRIQYAVRFVPTFSISLLIFRIFFLFASDYYDDNTSKSGTSNI